MFTSEQIESVIDSLNGAIGNVLNIFVQLLPIVALLAAAAFGIYSVWNLFRQL